MYPFFVRRYGTRRLRLRKHLRAYEEEVETEQKQQRCREPFLPASQEERCPNGGPEKVWVGVDLPPLFVPLSELDS